MSPTEKQIKFVEKINSVLGTNFPISSKEFTKHIFSQWISSHINEYNEIISNSDYDEDWIMEFGCVNDVWTEYY